MGARVLIPITVAVAIPGKVLGASHMVGAPAGSWDLQTNYTMWASRTSVPGHCIAGMKVQVNVKSKAVQTVQRCRGTGKRLRCRYETVLSSATAAGIDQSAVVRLGLAIVAAGLLLFFY
ncbi:hypothetical protein CFC21_003234 [Triticum aestivum]|uniref:Phytocyanin domain-containing protein n=2 Tax=Triticum TaxID=4564 RepID=A0A9R0QFW0_TRITD|nr:hypothetical protein CFC21_003234 [Triticum aestivum]VAH08852.1 unnamed protein product [Triticum turgidum subsp. durum]